MKPEKKKRPLRVYLAVGFLIFSVLLLGVLWLFQTVFLEAFYKNIKTSQVKSCVNSLADNIESDELYDLISDIEEQNNMGVAIYDTSTPIFSNIYFTEQRPGFTFDMSMSRIYDLYNEATANNREYSTISNVGKERRFEIRSERRFGATSDEQITEDRKSVV